MDKLNVRSTGTYYKAYVQGEDAKHYIIDAVKGRCRCVEDQKIYKIRRQVRKRTTDDLWGEILKQAKADGMGDGDAPWNKPEKKEACCIVYPR